MIIFITTRGHGYTLKSLARNAFGVAAPKISVTHYDRMFGKRRFPRATYIFTDLERLAPWELRIAADLYKAMKAAGLRCLNDPARAMSRVELLTALKSSGLNPFSVYRADAAPRPKRFPVFIRAEQDHRSPDAALYYNQEALDQALCTLRESGIPLRGLLVIKHASESYADDLWAKWGSYRIGDAIIVEHIAVDSTWLVKTGDHSKVTESIANDERDAVESNRFAEDVRRAFEIGGIEFGRADHSTFQGRPIIYEINTNPSLPPFPKSKKKPGFRRETALLARSAMAKALFALDSEGGGSVTLAATKTRRPIRWWRPGFRTPKRP